MLKKLIALILTTLVINVQDLECARGKKRSAPIEQQENPGSKTEENKKTEANQEQSSFFGSAVRTLLVTHTKLLLSTTILLALAALATFGYHNPALNQVAQLAHYWSLIIISFRHTKLLLSTTPKFVVSTAFWKYKKTTILLALAALATFGYHNPALAQHYATLISTYAFDKLPQWMQDIIRTIMNYNISACVTDCNNQYSSIITGTTEKLSTAQKTLADIAKTLSEGGGGIFGKELTDMHNTAARKVSEFNVALSGFTEQLNKCKINCVS